MLILAEFLGWNAGSKITHLMIVLWILFLLRFSVSCLAVVYFVDDRRNTTGKRYFRQHFSRILLFKRRCGSLCGAINFNIN